jgi:hypothetical protein
MYIAFLASHLLIKLTFRFGFFTTKLLIGTFPDVVSTIILSNWSMERSFAGYRTYISTSSSTSSGLYLPIMIPLVTKLTAFPIVNTSAPNCDALGLSIINSQSTSGTGNVSSIPTNPSILSSI